MTISRDAISSGVRLAIGSVILIALLVGLGYVLLGVFG